MSNIHERLVKFRKKKNFSIKRISTYIGVAESTYRGWEYGTQITGEPYQKLSQIFDITLFELFGIPESSKHRIEIRLANIEKLLKEIQFELSENENQNR